MFLRITGDINYYLKRVQWIKYFDEFNISKKTSFYIRKIEKKVNDKNTFTYFKYWILWKWVNMNFELNESFIFHFKRNIKKMNLTLSAKEERFLIEVEELIFNSWRPLKQIPVKFNLDKKEKINLLQTNVNVHIFKKDLIEKKVVQLGKFDFYFSNKNLFFTNSFQKIQRIINYEEIKSVTAEIYGIIIETEDNKYLIRGKNKLLTYVLLQRMVPKLNLNINNISKIYNYFDFWNILLLKIN
ncbi:hypothetical protein [Spiroplasma taiwanense]|uniref:Uncharacterized protein n=1 Tax=Spiroplasma taiwanense CT-1 TaxID=1276220 RepID=S5MG81_9MOLU|nr:hypothetical protein [Spiroplasma taiwanense]AGR40865.1 hypothetical protein STAIW_v1c01880 [Spiroplasma taiwanense CT-1]